MDVFYYTSKIPDACVKKYSSDFLDIAVQMYGKFHLLNTNKNNAFFFWSGKVNQADYCIFIH